MWHRCWCWAPPVTGVGRVAEIIAVLAGVGGWVRDLTSRRSHNNVEFDRPAPASPGPGAQWRRSRAAFRRCETSGRSFRDGVLGQSQLVGEEVVAGGLASSQRPATARSRNCGRAAALLAYLAPCAGSDRPCQRLRLARDMRRRACARFLARTALGRPRACACSPVRGRAGRRPVSARTRVSPCRRARDRRMLRARAPSPPASPGFRGRRSTHTRSGSARRA